MTGDGYIGAVVGGKDFIEHRLRPNVLIRRRLPVQRLPQQIVLGKSRLDLIARKTLMDIRSCAPPITRMPTDTLSKQLFYLRHERMARW